MKQKEFCDKCIRKNTSYIKYVGRNMIGVDACEVCRVKEFAKQQEEDKKDA